MIWFFLGSLMAITAAAGGGFVLGVHRQGRKGEKALQQERAKQPVSLEEHRALQEQLTASQQHVKTLEAHLDPLQEICSCGHDIIYHGREGCNRRHPKGWTCGCLLSPSGVLRLLERREERRRALQQEGPSSMPLLQDKVPPRPSRGADTADEATSPEGA